MGENGTVIVSADSSNSYVANILAAGQKLVIDESHVEQQVEKNGPDPYDYILSALGACTAVTMHMYAKRKNWPLERVEVRLQHKTIISRDPSRPEKNVKRLHITKELFITGNLTPEQLQRLENISGRCPVQKVLETGMTVKSVLINNGNVL